MIKNWDKDESKKSLYKYGLIVKMENEVKLNASLKIIH